MEKDSIIKKEESCTFTVNFMSKMDTGNWTITVAALNTSTSQTYTVYLKQVWIILYTTKNDILIFHREIDSISTDVVTLSFYDSCTYLLNVHSDALRVFEIISNNSCMHRFLRDYPIYRRNGRSVYRRLAKIYNDDGVMCAVYINDFKVT